MVKRSVNFKNLSEYIVMLPFEEQMYEVNNVIKYHENYKHPRTDIKQKFGLITDLKKFKKDLIELYLQELIDNPKLAVNSKPLYELLKVH